MGTTENRLWDLEMQKPSRVGRAEPRQEMGGGWVVVQLVECLVNTLGLKSPWFAPQHGINLM